MLGSLVKRHFVVIIESFIRRLFTIVIVFLSGFAEAQSQPEKIVVLEVLPITPAPVVTSVVEFTDKIPDVPVVTGAVTHAAKISETKELQNLALSKCGIEGVKRARAAGITLIDLYCCYGCNSDQFKAAGITDQELEEAGFENCPKIEIADGVVTKGAVVDNQKYWSYFEVGARGIKHSQQNAKMAMSYDLFMPIVAQHYDQLLFTDLRIFDPSGSAFVGNAYLGYRHLFPEGDRGIKQILGVYGSFDRMRSDYENYYNQITLGGEYWLNDWFIGSNVYLPIGRRNRLVNENRRLSNTYKISDKTYEEIAKGVDGEVGYSLTNDLTGYLGGFYYSGRNIKASKGFSARLEYFFHQNSKERILGIFDGAKLRLGVRKPMPAGVEGFVELKLRIGMGVYPNQYLSPFESHMIDLIRRDSRIVTGVYNVQEISKESDASVKQDLTQKDPPGGGNPGDSSKNKSKQYSKNPNKSKHKITTALNYQQGSAAEWQNVEYDMEQGEVDDVVGDQTPFWTPWIPWMQRAGLVAATAGVCAAGIIVGRRHGKQMFAAASSGFAATRSQISPLLPPNLASYTPYVPSVSTVASTAVSATSSSTSSTMLDQVDTLAIPAAIYLAQQRLKVPSYVLQQAQTAVLSNTTVVDATLMNVSSQASANPEATPMRRIDVGSTATEQPPLPASNVLPPSTTSNVAPQICPVQQEFNNAMLQGQTAVSLNTAVVNADSINVNSQANVTPDGSPQRIEVSSEATRQLLPSSVPSASAATVAPPASASQQGANAAVPQGQAVVASNTTVADANSLNVNSQANANPEVPPMRRIDVTSTERSQQSAALLSQLITGLQTQSRQMPQEQVALLSDVINVLDESRRILIQGERTAASSFSSSSSDMQHISVEETVVNAIRQVVQQGVIYQTGRAMQQCLSAREQKAILSYVVEVLEQHSIRINGERERAELSEVINFLWINITGERASSPYLRGRSPAAVQNIIPPRLTSSFLPPGFRLYNVPPNKTKMTIKKQGNNPEAYLGGVPQDDPGSNGKERVDEEKKPKHERANSG